MTADQKIRSAITKDAERLSELGARTFVETYTGLGHPLPAMIEEYAKEMFATGRIERELGSGGVHYLVAEDTDSALLGYGKLVQEDPPDVVRDGEGLWFLERLYLDGTSQGKGAGRRLLSELETCARNAGATGLWLTVWKQNRRAISFYEAMGFAGSGTDEWAYEWSGQRHADTDVVMVKRFRLD